MQKINKAGLTLILTVFMFDFVMLLTGGIKEGKEADVTLFNIILFFVGSVMFGVD